MAASFLLLGPTLAVAQQGDGIRLDDNSDEFHQKWSKRVLKLADSIDSFFGDDRVEDDAQQTRVKLRLDLFHDENNDFKTRVRLAGKISLPRLENRLSLVVNGDYDENEDNSDSTQERSLAIRFDSENSRLKNISYDAGIKRPDGTYRFFVRARYRKTRPMSEWVRRFDSKLFAYAGYGLEYDGILDFDRSLNPSLLFRYRTRLRWWQDDEKCNAGLCPEQHLIFYQRMNSPNHALSYELNTFFETDPTDDSDDYLREGRLFLRYRHRTRWDWAFYELMPTLAFPREQDYEPTWRIVLRLEGIFGYHPTYETLEFGPERFIR